MEMSQRNRVQAIKCKFESLNNDKDSMICRKNSEPNTKQLFKQNSFAASRYECHNNSTKENWQCNIVNRPQKEDKSAIDFTVTPNNSYLYKNTSKVIIETKKLNLTRQSSDPGKKLHRSHAFRCDRSQKIGNSPKRHSSCNGRPDSSEHPIKMEKPKLSKERLKKLGNLLEDRMKKENFVSTFNCQSEKMEIANDSLESSENVTPVKEEIPQHILDLYSKVLKNKKKVPEFQDNKKDGMIDSGVSSETENLEDNCEKNRVSKLKAQFEIPRINIENPTNPYELIEDNSDTSTTEMQSEKAINIYEKLNKSELENNLEEEELTDSFEKNEEKGILSNLELMETNDLCASSETMKLERKNPHLILTDTLKKALKQPLPNGPPPQKPPRTFIPSTSRTEKKNTLQMLEKLEIALQKQESKKHKPEKTKKEMHYLCTEILDITKRSLTINQNKCLGLNCANISSSYMSLPYTRLSAEMSICNCKPENVSSESPEAVESLCKNCHANMLKDSNFRCHLRCECQVKNSEFYVDKPEHIYDVPFSGDSDEISGNSTNDLTERNENEILATLQRKTENKYGLPNKLQGQSKSLESLTRREGLVTEDEKIYDTPCEEESQPSSPASKEKSRVNFENLLKNFESGKIEVSKNHQKPVIEHPKPIVTSESKRFKNIPKISKSTDNVVECIDPKDGDGTEKNVCLEHNFKPSSMKSRRNGTETRRFQKELSRSQNCLNFTKSDSRHQQDVDKENLSRLMNEIYETVSAACSMAERDRPAPSKFPLDQHAAPGDGTGSSEESVGLTRSLTEKRKNYVRRVSSRVAYLEPSNRRKYRHQTSVISYKSEILQENPYSTFRSWKSFRCSQGNLNLRKSPEMDLGSKTNLTDSRGNLMGNDFLDNLDNFSLDDKAGCLNLDLPFEPRQKSLFDICLLVGFNHMTGEAYVKSVFPTQVSVPPHIENLVFPETLSADEDSKPEYDLDAARTQCYSLVLTNERGERSYGYCRRVLPEGAAACLPLCYCIIGRYRAAGFYYKVLQEIESHHGSAEIENHKILQQLFDTDFPSPGTDIHLDFPERRNLTKNSIFRNSVNLGDILKSKTLPDNRRSFSPEKNTSMIPDFYDVENNNTKKLIVVENGRKLKRPLEPRIDEDNLSVLLDSLGAGLLIKVFGSLLLERKVVLVSDNLCQLSSCIEALQSILYPFVWQQPLISIIPSELRKDILEAPLPILAGMLKRHGVASDWESHLDGLLFEEGMLIDLSNSTSKVVFYQGDESTILPTVSYKTLKTSLQLESSRSSQKSQADGHTRNVLIAEAFLRFFVDILSDFWQHFSTGKLKNDDLGSNDVIFDKESFVKNAQSKHVQYFLEWFTETAMFSHFVQNMAVTYPVRQHVSPLSIDYSILEGVVDAPLPDFYHVFDERQKTRRECKKSVKNNDKNYKSVVNKKVRLLKSKLMDLVN